MAVQKLLVFDILVITVIIIRSATNIESQGNCSDTCGSVEVPYPFGVSPGCYYNSHFKLICNTTFNPPQLRFPESTVSVLNISLEKSEIRIRARTARDCYNELGNLTNDSFPRSDTITDSMFPVSTRNKFIAVGCDTVGVIGGIKGRWYASGCVPLCNKTSDLVNGSCSGIGCCQMDFPQEIWDFITISTSLGGKSNHTKVHDFNPCGFAFVAEEGVYNFSTLDLVNLQNRRAFPVVLDWAIGNFTCEEALKNETAYSCKAMNSECLNATNGPGHRCKCSTGFHGNPYLLDGCQDVDECKISNPCKMICKNLEGSYKCLCPKGFKGDGETNGTGCTKIDARNYNFVARLSIALGVCTVLLILFIGSSWIYLGAKKRNLVKLKEKFFKQNGGLLLQQQLLPHSNASGMSSEMGKIFTVQELKTATNNFDQSRIVGQGGYGTVYKGVLANKKVVAIKKSRVCDQSQIEQFINEVLVLSQVNHRNVVKLLGCCLETEVPLLVYEFITNGTLSDHVHKKLGQPSSFLWEMRLKIATETASAIAYLHSSASVPIIHRDIKTANILLDENYTAKVSDFGASRLVPMDQTKLNTLVQGTLGYLDPEYFHTSQLTEKSDVYSFGVVLAEILTGQKALSLDRPECDRNLAMYFVSSVKKGQLLQILDENMATEENVLREIEEVADLAKRCLRVRGEERPSMKEVARELEGLLRKDVIVHPWERNRDGDFTPEEANYLLRSSNLYNMGNVDFCSNEITLDNSYHEGR